MIRRMKIMIARIAGIKMINLIRNINPKRDDDESEIGVVVEKRLEKKY
jgi:hypothetical protein